MADGDVAGIPSTVYVGSRAGDGARLSPDGTRSSLWFDSKRCPEPLRKVDNMAPRLQNKSCGNLPKAKMLTWDGPPLATGFCLQSQNPNHRPGYLGSSAEGRKEADNACRTNGFRRKVGAVFSRRANGSRTNRMKADGSRSTSSLFRPRVPGRRFDRRRRVTAVAHRRERVVLSGAE